MNTDETPTPTDADDPTATAASPSVGPTVAALAERRIREGYPIGS